MTTIAVIGAGAWSGNWVRTLAAMPDAQLRWVCDLSEATLQRLNLGTVRSNEKAWWSLAPHDISVAWRLLGQWPPSVQCRGQNVVQRDVADVVFASLEFPGGRLAHVHVSWLDPSKTRRLTVV